MADGVRVVVALELLQHVGEAGRERAFDLLADVGLERAFDALIDLDYTYILVDAPPLLGIADTQALARRATSLLYVARLDRITLENIIDARDVLDRVDCPPFGMVVIGARTEASPYYLSGRVPALEDVGS